MPDPVHDPSRARVSRARMEKLAWWLDGLVRVPGTRWRFGLDSIIGLIPGVGDAVGLLLGATILYEGVRVGAPRSLIARMLGNSLADAIGGLVPVVGDLFDFAFKSNKLNAKLLTEHLDNVLETPAQAPVRGSRLFAVLMVLLFLAAAIAPLYLFWSWWLHH